MRSLLVGLLVLFTISCGPSEGDVYENLQTKQRVEVLRVGKCVEVYRFQQYHNNRADTALSYPKERKIARGNIKPIYPQYSDSSATCIGYGSEDDHPVYNVSQTKFVIEEKKSFLSDYQKIN